jgi:hypothetical protein
MPASFGDVNNQNVAPSQPNYRDAKLRRLLELRTICALDFQRWMIRANGDLSTINAVAIRINPKMLNFFDEIVARPRSGLMFWFRSLQSRRPRRDAPGRASSLFATDCERETLKNRAYATLWCVAILARCNDDNVDLGRL